MLIAQLNTNWWIVIGAITWISVITAYQTYRGRGVVYLARALSIAPLALLWAGVYWAYKLGVLPYYMGVYVVVGIAHYLFIRSGDRRRAKLKDLLFWYYRLEWAVEDHVLKLFGQPLRRRS